MNNDDDGEMLARFRADDEEFRMSQYGHSTDSQHTVLADSEVQKRWGEWVTLMLQQQRRVQGGQTIQEIYR